MNIAQANFEDVVAKYYDGTAAHAAAAHLRDLILKGKDQQLEELLRDYRYDPITAVLEIELRAATDRLLTCYSILEISSIASFIPAIPEEFALAATDILGNVHVRRYYETLYPTKLPVLFRRRLAGNGAVQDAPAHVSAVRAMMSFLELDRQFTEQLEDKTLLRMLDSFTIGGYRFRDVVTLMGTPDKFIDHLLLDADANEILALAASELGLFMQFCFDLRDLLDRCRDLPLLRSAIWTYYCYWFEILGDALKAQLGDALGRFLEWKVPEGAAKETSREIQDYVRRARVVLVDLTSGQLGAQVNDLL